MAYSSCTSKTSWRFSEAPNLALSVRLNIKHPSSYKRFYRRHAICWTKFYRISPDWISFNQFTLYTNVNSIGNSPVLCPLIVETIRRLAPPFTCRDVEDGSLLVTSAITDTNGRRFRLTGSHQRPDATKKNLADHRIRDVEHQNKHYQPLDLVGRTRKRKLYTFWMYLHTSRLQTIKPIAYRKFTAEFILCRSGRLFNVYAFLTISFCK